MNRQSELLDAGDDSYLDELIDPAVPEREFGTAARIAVVLLAIAIIMVDGFDLQAIGFVAPEIARSWSLDIASFGSVFSAALAGSMIGAMSAGPIARCIGLRSVLTLSLVLFGGCTLAVVQAADLVTLTALRFIAGLGLGAAVPVIMSIVASNSPTRFRATLVVLALCGQPVGAILGGALCARFIPAYGWTFAFYLGGILPLLLIAPVLLLLRRGVMDARNPANSLSRKAPDRLRDLFGNDLRATTLLLWPCAFLSIFFVYTFINWLPSSLRDSGHSLQMSVLAISLFNFGGIAGALLLGALMDRYGPLKVMPFALALASISTAVLDTVSAVPSLLLSAILLSGLAGYGAVMSLGALTVILYPASLQTLGAGWVLGVGRLGAALGPLGAGMALAVGLVVGHLFYFAAAAAAFAMLCLLLLGRIERSRTQR